MTRKIDDHFDPCMQGPPTLVGDRWWGSAISTHYPSVDVTDITPSREAV